LKKLNSDSHKALQTLGSDQAVTAAGA